MIMHFLPSNLKLLRKVLNLTQAQVAEQLDKQTRTIASYESGFSEPRPTDLVRLAHFLHIPVFALLLVDLREHPGYILPPQEKSSVLAETISLDVLQHFIDATQKGQRVCQGMKATLDFLEAEHLDFQDLGDQWQQLFLVLKNILEENNRLLKALGEALDEGLEYE